ncbi:MAG: Rqc2 family fibronectin-binding protein [Bacillota bacterium]|uniref:Rqc2 family fibronectin-binding protein n=1 Tax=Virgibacillus TaxID=84406 RepID=UPI0004016F4C|nr:MULTISPECIES: NFACT RNA binding domain-containing protein [Bacillaceae]MCC2251920.1 NFACT family protein [Virgibacillus sp. AGTR]MDY7045624.1 NFACT RNA binding domain-containing protein [Virgibacillus sp. M23]QRZ17375.1 NFACT family protein [Virgibacillus sp. AGTR]
MPFDGIVTHAVTEELKNEMIPGKITKIYQPTDSELLFTIRSKGKNMTLLLSIHPTYARFHLTNDSFANPKEPPMFCMVLRKHLSGAIIENIEQYGMERIVQLTIKTRNEIGDLTSKALIIELMGKHSNITLVDDEENQIIDSFKHISMSQNRHRTLLPGHLYQLPPEQNKLNALTIDSEQFIKRLDFNAGKLNNQIVQSLVGFSPFIAREMVQRAELGSIEAYQKVFDEIQKQIVQSNFRPTIYNDKKEDFHVIPLANFTGDQIHFSTTNQMLDQFYSGKAERDRVKQQAKDLYRFLKNEKEKNRRKLKKHEQTVKKARNKDHYQKLGELLTAHLHLISTGDQSVTVTDYYDPEQKELTIELNPNKTPSENAQSYYKTYQKLKKSERIVTIEIEKTKDEIAYMEQLQQQVESASSSDIEEIRDELREEGYLKKQPKKKKKRNKAEKPVPEQYTASDGTVILVGKNNKQNEYLTMKLAARDEIWLHTKDIPGSHVIIRDKQPSDETLMEAAQLAAYFSKSRQSSSVPVDYTKVRHVKKPNGAKPGYVTYENQKTLFVTPSNSLIQKLK